VTSELQVIKFAFLSIENRRYGKARGNHARVKRVWAILLFFTQIGFIVFTYVVQADTKKALQKQKPPLSK
jgi:hypothetical protein